MLQNKPVKITFHMNPKLWNGHLLAAIGDALWNGVNRCINAGMLPVVRQSLWHNIISEIDDDAK